VSGAASRWTAALAGLAVVLTGCGDVPAPGSAPTASSTPSTSYSPSTATPTPTRTPARTPTRTPTTPTRTTPVTPPPSRTLPAGLAGVDWTRIPTRRKVVALTFDAGSDGAAVSSVLGTLRREGVRATFFLTGDWVDRYPRTAAAIAATHRVGNHSQTHPHFTRLSDSRVATELSGAELRIRRVAGQDPVPLFRFPYGDRDQRVIRLVNRSGYVPVRWTVDTLGWRGTANGNSAARVVDRVLAGLAPGEIVLMQVGSNPDDGSTLDADALPVIITRLRAAGYGFVTLDALTG
jgi:peptidoglycan/xylan/chitin deacetylase (PgdA/CDA1 family)